MLNMFDRVILTYIYCENIRNLTYFWVGMIYLEHESMEDNKITIDGLALKVDDLAEKMASGFADSKRSYNDLVKTVDDLASSTASGFADTYKRFDNIDKEIKTLNAKFDLHDGELKLMRSEMEQEFRELKKETESIKLKLDKLEKTTDEDIITLGDEIYHIKLRTKKLEQKIAKLKSA